jgi:hypothetical protein
MAVNACWQCIHAADLESLSRAARNDAQAVEKFLYPEPRTFGPRPLKLTVARSWLGLHSLLTFGRWREQPLLAKAILGGTEVGFPFARTDDVRCLSADEVQEIAIALDGVSESALRGDFDADALNAAGVLPAGEWTAQDIEYLWQTFAGISAFFVDAARRRDALLLYRQL